MRRDAAIFGVIGDVAVGKLFALWRGGTHGSNPLCSTGQSAQVAA
jgi:hypothetical protein